jgi:hypothetical protein
MYLTQLVTTALFLSAAGAIAQDDRDAFPEPVNLIRQTIANEDSYWIQQQKYACSYQIVTRDRYDTGISTHAVGQTDQIIILHGNTATIVNSKTGKEVQGKDVKAITSSQLFSTWRDPLFESVVEHSKFTNEYLVRERTGRSVVVIQYQGDSEYKPTSDTDRIAQSLSGRIVIDPSEKVFVSITGSTDFDVVDGKRFLIVGRHPWGIPLLDYHAVFYNTAYLPTLWSQASYHAVRNDREAIRNWLGTLSRTFMQRIACQEYRQSMRILPGMVVEPKDTTDQQETTKPK